MISEEDVLTFTDGFCNIFAEELHRLYNYPIVFIGANRIWMHVVVIRKGRYVDIRGAVPLKQLFKEYQSDTLMTAEQAEYYLDNKQYPWMRKKARKIIKQHPKRFGP